MTEAAGPQGSCPPDPPERLWAMTSWLVGHVFGDSRRLINQALGNPGARTDLAVLAGLDQYGPISQAQLGRRLGINLSEMVAVLRRLEADQLVVRADDAQDRRKNTIEMTDKGRGVLDDLEATALTAQAQLLEPLSKEQRAQLAELLQTLVEHHHDYARPDKPTGHEPT